MTRRRKSNTGAVKRPLGIPPSALGAIGEARLFEILTVLGRGQFVCYPPRADIEGTDSLVKRRYRAGAVAIQVKTRDYADKYGNLTLAVDAEDIPVEDPKLIVLFDYDTARAELGRFCWVIPDDVYRAQSTFTSGKYEATFSRKPTAVGRWVDFRCAPGDLPRVIGWYLGDKDGREGVRGVSPGSRERQRVQVTRGSRPRRVRAPARARPASRSRRRPR